MESIDVYRFWSLHKFLKKGGLERLCQIVESTVQVEWTTNWAAAVVASDSQERL